VSPVKRLRSSAQRTFLSLRTSRNFRLYLFGQFVSTSGTWVNATASAWLVLRLTNSGVALGVNTALLFLPILILGAWGGVLADRFDKRRILVWTQSAFALTAFGMFAIVVTGVDRLWMVYALSVVAGIVTAIDNPTRQSFYVEMVGQDAISNAVSLNSAAFTGSRIIGPAIAAALIATVGLAAPFMVDGVSYLAVIVALVMMRPAEFHRQERTTRERGHLVAGLRYVWQTDELRRPLWVMAVIFTFSFNFAVLLPLLAQRTFSGNAGTLGLLSALAGVGSCLGALTMANRARTPTMQRLAVHAVGFGLALIVAGAAPTLALAAAAMVLVGFATMTFMITANTILQVNARPQARGRVMALYGVVFLGSTPIGSPIAGWVGQQFGAPIGLVGGGVIALALGVGVLWQLRRVRVASPAFDTSIAPGRAA
jgi:MFS family permease